MSITPSNRLESFARSAYRRGFDSRRLAVIVRKNTRQAPASAGVWGPRVATGLAAMLLASFMAGLNDRVTATALADIRGALGIGHDEGTWVLALYEATNVAMMAFAPWFAGTFSIRLFSIFAIMIVAGTALLCPFAPNVEMLLVLRTVQGIGAGCLPPLLLTVCLRYLPPHIRLYGLAGYAMTATFGPNLATPLAALWTDYVSWQMAFWQIVPLCLFSAVGLAWGLPQDALRLERLRQFNWIGFVTGFSAIAMLVIALMQGDRLDWLRSDVICALLMGGVGLLGFFFVNEWTHPQPFIRLHLLTQRNFVHALVSLTGILVVFAGLTAIPTAYLGSVRDYRPLEVAPMLLLVALPQVVTLPLTAALLNIPRVDCRWVMGIGFALVCASCALGSFLTEEWVRENFYLLQAMLILGQPMIVVSILMELTGGMAPSDGPFTSAMFNTCKGFATAIGVAVVSSLTRDRGRYHSEMTVDRLGNVPGISMPDMSTDAALRAIGARIRDQVNVLTAADLYRVMGLITFALLLLTLFLPTRTVPPRPVGAPPSR